jgi:hypothetical protein
MTLAWEITLVVINLACRSTYFGKADIQSNNEIINVIVIAVTQMTMRSRKSKDRQYNVPIQAIAIM